MNRGSYDREVQLNCDKLAVGNLGFGKGHLRLWLVIEGWGMGVGLIVMLRGVTEEIRKVASGRSPR